MAQNLTVMNIGGVLVGASRLRGVQRVAVSKRRLCCGLVNECQVVIELLGAALQPEDPRTDLVEAGSSRTVRGKRDASVGQSQGIVYSWAVGLGEVNLDLADRWALTARLPVQRSRAEKGGTRGHQCDASHASKQCWVEGLQTQPQSNVRPCER
jgi:hypothetical protein